MTVLEIKDSVKKYGLSYPSNDELIRLIGKNKMEYVEEYLKRQNSKKKRCLSSQEAVAYFQHTSLYKQEVFSVMYLDGGKEIIGIEEISKGTVNRSLFSCRDVFREAIKSNSAAIIVSHNHPSGDASPSKEDLKTTETLVKAGEILGVQVLDHIIIGDNYYSFLEHNQM